MPFNEYVNTASEVTFSPMQVQPPVNGYEDHGSKLELDIDGMPAGGYRSKVPGWLDSLWNCKFRNNAGDSVGMYYWGKQLKDESLVDKARRSIKLLLAAPQNEYGRFQTGPLTC